jgi:hypothetical protein
MPKASAAPARPAAPSIRYPESQYSKENKEWEFAHGTQHLAAPRFTSEWIPVQILPNEGLLLNLEQPQQEEPVLIFVVLEWQEVREVEDEVKPMHEMAVARLAAMQYSEALAAEIAQEEAAVQKTQSPRPQIPDWQKDPHAYLEFALKGLAKKPQTSPPTG